MVVLAVVVAALALTWVLAPAARAQEVPAPPAGTGAPAADAPAEIIPPPEATPPPEPAPEPPPPPPPPEVVNPPEPTPAEQAPAEESSQPASPRSSDTPRDAGHAASATPPATPTSVMPLPPAAPSVEAVADTQTTAAPLGWDVYDDALFAETVDSDEDAAMLAGGGSRAFGGLGVLGPITHPTARDKHRDAATGSRPNATPVGGSGPGGGGPGPGQSLGLGGGGGGSAGIALLTLLGLACGWSLVAPRDRRAFRTSTATWRPSAYVPPIEHPG